MKISHWRIAAVLLLSITACFPQNRLDGHVYYRINHNPSTLDPALIVDVTGGLIAAKIFNGLVRLDENLEIVPDIAERWELKDRGLTYIFHLKKGVCFTNGREVTAHDFIYSFRRVLTQGMRSPNTWVLDKIEGAREYAGGRREDIPGLQAQDDHTLRIRLTRPFSPFLQLLSMTAAYVVPREEAELRGNDFSVRPVGTGPFMLSAWKHNQEVVLQRNPGYFEGIPKARGVVYRVIPEDLTALTEFEVGNLDVISVPATEYRKYAESPRWRDLIASRDGLNTYYLGFNCARPPFDSADIRRAVYHAIDRKKILKTFYEDRGSLAYGPIPGSMRKWQPPAVDGYDPEKARQTIERKGMKGKTVRFYITADQEVRDIAEILQSYLKKAGLDVRITQLEWSAYKEALNHGEADLFWISWWADYPDPENFLFPLFHSSNHGASGNRTRYTNREVDRYIEAAQEEPDQRKRNTSYALAEAIIIREMPWVPFWHKKDITVRQPYLKEYRIYPVYSIDKGTGIFL